MLAPGVTRNRAGVGMIAVATLGNGFAEPAAAEDQSGRRRNSLRQVLLIRAEGGYWIAECPSLPGCTGEGRSRESAIASVKETIASHLAELEACGLPVPEECFDALIVAV
jgi:predicted RNase H-like HicB family nuclease